MTRTTHTCEDAVQAVCKLLLAGMTCEDIRRAAADSDELTDLIGDDDAMETALAAARRRLTIAADYNRDEELGIALRRCHDLYAAAMEMSDPKAALAAEKERARLLGLAAPPAAESADPETSDTDRPPTPTESLYDALDALEEALKPHTDAARDAHAGYDAIVAAATSVLTRLKPRKSAKKARKRKSAKKAPKRKSAGKAKKSSKTPKKKTAKKAAKSRRTK